MLQTRNTLGWSEPVPADGDPGSEVTHVSRGAAGGGVSSVNTNEGEWRVIASGSEGAL